MRELPILFAPDLAQKVYLGLKTETRRLVKPQPVLPFVRGVNIRGKPLGILESESAAENEPHGFVSSWARYQPGDLLLLTQEALPSFGKSSADRFWERVIKTGDCWEWFGKVDHKLYGRFKVGNKDLSVHRYSWEIHKGPVPMGLHVLHTCDVRWCVRPEHLYLGTDIENTADKLSRRRVVRLHGERNHASKITDAMAANIFRLRSEGLEQSELARRFGISQSQVSRILSGKRRAPQEDERPALTGSRWLEVLSVSVEKVSEITREGARAEGYPVHDWNAKGVLHMEDRSLFREAWNARYPGTWEANAWVWVIKFKKVEAPNGRA